VTKFWNMRLGSEALPNEYENEVLNKRVDEADLDKALLYCSRTGVDLVVYILIKPQTLTEEGAIIDAVGSALHVLNKAATLV